MTATLAPELLILKLQGPEERDSPEYRYLLSQVGVEAAKAFAGVEIEERLAGSAVSHLRVAPYVLVLATGSLLVAAATLARLRQAVDRGALFATPSLLAAQPELETRPVHSLRGFERLEQAVLDRQGESGASPTQQGPVALFSQTHFQEWLRRRGGIQAAADRLPWRPEELDRARTVGLYHQFIDYYGEERGDILPYLPAGARDVLEIGCARGRTGSFLQEKLGVRVTGVDLNPVVALEASKVLHRAIHGDVLALEFEQELEEAFDEAFDVVLALELFEHLTEGELFLERARRWLRPGGRILLSVPNVGHYSVVEDLLAGRWDYLPIGLLCYTHYRFFTRKTLEDWLRRCGFSQFRLEAQRTELPAAFEKLPPAWEVDAESLATKGFYVLIERD